MIHYHLICYDIHVMFQATCLFLGFLQYIESTPVAEVLATEGSIQNFFRKHHPSETGPFGIAPDVMETYTSSCGKFSQLVLIMWTCICILIRYCVSVMLSVLSKYIECLNRKLLTSTFVIV